MRYESGTHKGREASRRGRGVLRLLGLGLGVSWAVWPGGGPHAQPARAAVPSAEGSQTRLYLPLVQRDHSLPGYHGPVQALPVATLGGLIGPTDIQGRYAYIVLGPALVVVDLADPGQPREVGRLLLPRRPQALEVAGRYVYLARESDLWIVDVADPARPSEVSRTDVGRELAQGHGWDQPVILALHDVFVHGHYAFLADDNGAGAQIVDVADPARPRWVAGACSGDADSVYVADNTVYVTNDDGDLCMEDVTDPTRAVPLADVPLDSSWYVVVAGRTAYVLGTAPSLSDGQPTTALWLVDVADRRRPTIVGMVPAPVGPVHVAGGYAYVATSRDGIRVVDVTAPSAPRVVAQQPWPGPVTEVLPTAGHAVVVDPSAGLVLLDRSRPSELREVGAYRPGAFAGDQLAVRGAFAHVVSGTGGVQVLEVSNPAGARRVAQYGGAEAQRVTLDGTFAYVAAGEGGLRIYDVTLPEAPRRVGALLEGQTLPGGGVLEVQDVAVAAGRAYVATGAGGLWVADVADPGAPKILGHLAAVQARRLVVDGRRVLATDNTGLQVVDVADPADPRRLGEVQLARDVYQAPPVFVAGTTAYVGTNVTLHIISLTDPRVPRSIGEMDAGGYITELAAEGPLLAMATSSFGYPAGTAILDISAPGHPHQIGFVTGVGSGCFGVAIRADTLFVGEGSAGLSVFRLR